MAKTKPKKAADLARKIWRTQGKCEVIPCRSKIRNPQLHGAHLIGVGTAIRICSDIRNGFCLCSYDHGYFGDHPHEFVEWIETTWAKEYVPILREKARPGQGQKVDWEERLRFLNDVYLRLESGSLSIEEARKLED